jgi:DNA replication protein DnaC
MKDFNDNSDARMAWMFVEHTGRNVFLTGRAGTGKTTFLKYVMEHTGKRVIVTAPTGVAAINAGGMTLHSFFQLSLGPLVPEAIRESDYTHRFNKNKISIIKTLDLLVIDEISMVRADVLDAVDLVLRRSGGTTCRLEVCSCSS